MLKLLAPLALLASFASCAGSAPPPPAAPASRPSSPPSSEVELTSKIDRIFSVYDVKGPGCAVGVYRAGEIVFAKGYGYANLEHGIPNTKDTVFELGSVSKHFTATAVLLLADDGKLALDDDVRKYLPELPALPRVVTLRQLLHHTSGYREYDDLLSLSGYDVADVATEPDTLHLLTLQRGMNFDAGTEYSYSNTGYFLLGQVVRRASGKSLADFSRERIFAPLGMHDTLILDDHTRIVPRRATGYQERDGGGFAISMSNREATGEGNIQTSIVDLARWDANFYDPKVGGAAWLTAMRTPGKLASGKPTPSAMDLNLADFRGFPSEEHSGGWAGYRTYILRLPTERLAVAVLCNTADADAGALAKATASEFLPTSASGVTGAASAAHDAPGVDASAGAPTEADRARMLGTYLERSSLDVRTVTQQGRELALGFGGPLRRPLDAIGPRTLRVRGTATTYELKPGATAIADKLVRTTAGETTTYERFEPISVTLAGLAEYRGRYRSVETTHDLAVDVAEGVLVSSPWGKRADGARYESVARDVFIEPGGGLVFERDKRGKVIGVVSYFNGHAAVRWTKVE